MDWLFVRVNLRKRKKKRQKKRPYCILFFSVVKGLSRSGRVEPWFYGEALPACWVSHVTDVAFLHLSIAYDQSFKMFGRYHMQTSPSLDKT